MKGKKTRIILISFTAIFLLWSVSFFADFLWDDEDWLTENVYVKRFWVGRFFTENAIAGRGKVSNYYRPVHLLLNSIEYQLFGLTPFFYHLNNVLLHLLAGYLAYCLLKKITKSFWRSFLPVVVFLIHPLQTESISYATGRSDPLYVIFVLLSLLFFLADKKVWLGLSVLLGLLSKELAVVVFPLSFGLMFLQWPHIEKGERGRWLENLWLVGMIVFAYFFARFTFLQFRELKEIWGDSLYYQNLGVRLLTFPKVFFVYLGLLFFPWQLHMEREQTLSLVTDPAGVYPLGFVGVVLPGGLFLLWVKKHWENWRLVWFSVFGFFVCLGPVSGVVPLNGIIYEHFLYFSILFFAFFWVLIGEKVCKSSLAKKIAIVVFALWLVFLAGRNILRQLDWVDPVRFYRQTLEHAPESIRVYNNLGMELANRGQHQQAIQAYQQGISIGDIYPNLHYNMGNSYLAVGKKEQAAAEYKKALEIDPDFYFASNALQRLEQD